MSEYFLISLVFFAIVMSVMAIGAIFQGKELKGSCGGLGRVMGEDCMFCDKKDACETPEDECESSCAPKLVIENNRVTLSIE